MIRFYKIVLYISILFLFSQFLYSQKIEIGPEIGFGKSEISGYERIIISPVSPFKKDYLNSLKLGFMGYWFTKKELISLNSGIIYNQRTESDYYNLYFLRTPIGLDFNFGKRFKIFFGGGIYLQLLVSYNCYDPSDLDNSKRLFQLGRLFNIGIGYQFFDNATFFIKYDNNYELTMIYKESSFSPAVQQVFYDPYKGYDANICFGLRYRIKK